MRCQGVAIVLSGAALLLPTAVAGGNVEYRVVDLGLLADEGDASAAYGINDWGHVVGLVDTGSTTTAFVWILGSTATARPTYGYSAGALHELSASGDTRARDINIDGLVVGQSDSDSADDQIATMWLLSSGSAAWETIGTPPGEAWDVNDLEDPLVVGTHRPEMGCDNTEELDRGFVLSVDLSSFPTTHQTPTDLDPFDDDTDHSHTFGINNASSGTATWKAGSVKKAVCSNEIVPQCDGDVDAIRWDGTTVGGLQGVYELEEGRGVNDENAGEHVVGFGLEASACIERALFWPSTSTVVDLNDDWDNGSSRTRAEAINNADMIVGWDISEQLALRWRPLGGSSFVGEDLNDPLSVYCAEYELVLLQAHDINEDGWIVGIGEFSTGEEDPVLHAFLLIPENVECPGDVNWDGAVDVDDIIQVILDWGSCAPEEACLGDANLDCEVDDDDLAIVTDDENEGECGAEALGGGGFTPWTLYVVELFREATITAEQAVELLQAGE